MANKENSLLFLKCPFLYSLVLVCYTECLATLGFKNTLPCISTIVITIVR